MGMTETESLYTELCQLVHLPNVMPKYLTLMDVQYMMKLFKGLHDKQ